MRRQTFDGMLNDINSHVEEAPTSSKRSTVPGRRVVREGGVDGGAGVVGLYGSPAFGTSSRVTKAGSDSYTVGVLVQAELSRARDCS